MGEVYTYLKGPIPRVPWAQVVWSSYGIPRHSFLTWLVLLDRCLTSDRLIRWDIAVDHKCLLCNVSNKSRNHLFFLMFLQWFYLERYRKKMWIAGSVKLGKHSAATSITQGQSRLETVDSPCHPSHHLLDLE